MTNFEKVESYYANNKKLLKYFEDKLYKDFDIPKYITKDTIKRYLVQIVCNQGASTQLLKKRNVILSIFLYPIVFFYFFYLSLFAKKSNKAEVDILYEEWNSIGTHFEKFYRPIYKALSPRKQAVFSVTKEKNSSFQNDIEIIERNINFNFDKEISQKVFKKSFTNFFSFLNFSIKYDFDFLNLYLRILRAMCKYETESKSIKADFLITACDNGYNALRYYIYKKNGIKNIISIQNGARGDNHPAGGDMYIYSDFYFSHGKLQTKNMHGLKVKEIIYSGSFTLYFLSQKYKNINIDYDVVLIEQYVPGELENSYKFSTFKKIIENLKQFSKKNKNLKIAYRVRMTREICQNNHYLIVDELLKNTNIIFESSQSNDSYEAIMKSKVVLNYCSTLGFESIGFGKKVLTCNYDNFDFLENKDSVSVSLNSDYEEFEKKLLYLLNTDYSLIENHYNKLKLDYMNINGNPVDKLVEIVEREQI